MQRIIALSILLLQEVARSVTATTLATEKHMNKVPDIATRRQTHVYANGLARIYLRKQCMEFE